MTERATPLGTARVVGLAVVGIAIAAFLIWHIHIAAVEAENPPEAPSSEPLDPVTYARVSELRGRLRLSDATLAAMACDARMAEAVLTRVVTWDRANGTTWVARREEVAAARTVLRRAERTARTGPRNPTLLGGLPGLRQAVERAKQAEAELIATAAGQVALRPGSVQEAVLSATQQRLWATVRANPEGDYAFAGSLAAAQRTALTQAHRRLARDHATGRTAADHEAAEERFRGAVDGILTTTQKAAIETARANARQFLPAVRAASQAVLPPPSGPAAAGEGNVRGRAGSYPGNT